MYGMNTRSLPGTLAPIYQELQVERSEPPATSRTCATQFSSASACASMRLSPSSRKYPMQSATHSTCCSIDGSMLVSTAGLPGPVMVKRLGKPAMPRPRYVFGPSRHFSLSAWPPVPRMSIFNSAPVIASEAGREHDRIDCVFLILGPNVSRRDRLGRLAADVDQGDIWAVIGLPVAGIDAEPLAADDVARREHLSDLRIGHDLSRILANKLGREVIGRLIVRVGHRTH